MGDVVAQSVDIDAPIGEVWDLIMDPERLGEWVSIHRSVSDLPEGDLKKGSRFRQEMKLKGVPLKVKWEVVECRRPKHARWQGKAGAGATARISYDLSTHDGKTRFDYENEFKAPGGVLGAAASRVIVGGVPQREANRSLQRLKSLLEG